MFRLPRPIESLLILVALGGVLYGAYYSFQVSRSQTTNRWNDYWDGTVGNGIATFAGLVVGIPSAFWLERRLRKEEEDAEKAEDATKAKRIVAILRQELASNQEALGERIEDKNTFILSPLKTSVWDAFSSSGELQYIDSPELVGLLAQTYYVVRAVAKIEEHAYSNLYDAAFAYTMPDGTKASPSTRYYDDAKKFHRALTAGLVKAINKLDEVYPYSQS